MAPGRLTRRRPSTTTPRAARRARQRNSRREDRAIKTRFTIVGTGNRGLGCFAKGLLGWETKGLPEFPQRAELVALVDANLTRARLCAAELHRPELPVYRDVTAAQGETPADWAIVTTPDFTHREVVEAALGAGLNVLVDKPLATSAWECDRIIRAMHRSGRQVVVGHNMRYNRAVLAAAKAVRGGRIGRVLMVEAAEVLDYNHGGDYFHRWHSDFRRSAGLMNHKCCHHLDAICWMLQDEPVAVAASGARSFYRPRPDLNHGERCSDCPIAGDCPHFFDMDKWDGVRRRIYMGAEHEDGYLRDRCVFSDRHTICDHESLNIRYAKGTIGSFTMVAFAPREYWYFHFTGTAGRLEAGVSVAAEKAEGYLRVTGADGTVEDVDVRRDRGEHGHGGADVKLLADILGLGGSDPLQRARPEEARRAVLVADLAARSIASGGRAVPAEEAGKDYPPAPPQP
jgi:predicted dehydrogenase